MALEGASSMVMLGAIHRVLESAIEHYAGHTMVTGSITLKATHVAWEKFIAQQNDAIKTANVPHGGGNGGMPGSKIAYFIPPGPIAKKFRDMDNKQLDFVTWDLFTGAAVACWKKHPKKKAPKCLDFKGTFLGCAWDGHHMPNRTVTFRVPKVDGEVEVQWFMPGRRPENCWSGFPNGDKPYSQIFPELADANTTMDDTPAPRPAEWPPTEHWPKGSTPELQAAALKIADEQAHEP